MTEDPKAPAVPAILGDVAHLGRRVPGIEMFTLFSFVPVPVLALGCLFGSFFLWIALIWMVVGMPLLDRLMRRAAPDAPEGADFADADILLITLAVAHFALLALLLVAVTGMTGLGIVERIAAFLACGLFIGQVSGATAHELIHRADRRLFQLGQWIYISLLYGQHVSAHRLVHHPLVGTRADPNTAVLGESFWAYLGQVWPAEFRAGWRAEQALPADARPKVPAYAVYLAGGLGFVLLVWIVFGLIGLVAYLLLCLFAQMQILLVDYVQHYGLERRRLGEGYEPVGAGHSWDAPDPVSALWMLNAPRHSDHHAHPARPYPNLALGDVQAPGRAILPFSLPVMSVIALSPRLWHRMMDRRVRALRSRQAAAWPPAESRPPVESRAAS
ncbi:alkane 1-monooxygenase [Paenirhodobacter populi]|uniref:alkane 1-monooxygenase n=1 Tax=Paenirhodobacter populi TaxID=2306993 RepID=UPI001F502EA8|nr:alkane 1-monooxygenase [Sinirhodobacter populi]